MSAISIPKLLNTNTAIDFLRPALKDLLQLYLNMMKEFESSEELVTALHSLVNSYPKDIAEFANLVTE